MEHVTRSAYFSALQSCMVRGGVYKWLPYTTLNEKFNVLPGEYPPAAVYPTLGFIAIGRGGLKMGVDADGEPFPDIGQHRSDDAALFNAMPIVLRLIDDDLPIGRRGNYAMRQRLNIKGSDYWAYWLKRHDFSQADSDLFLKTVLENGEVRVDPFVPSQENLNPVRVDLSESGSNILKGQSIISSTLITIPLDAFDINEIRNASKIIKGTDGKANVSEIAICTGALKQILAPGQSGTFPFMEGIGVQIASTIKALYPLDYINQALTDQLELGISEPLFKFEGNPTPT